MTRLSLTDVKKRLKLYGFNVNNVERWHVGTSGNCFVVWLNDEKFVLKLFEKSKKEMVQHDINFLRKINSKKKIMIFPLNSKALLFNDSAGYIYKFIDLPLFREVKIPRKLFEFGRIVGEFNRICRKILPNKISNKCIIEIVKDSNVLISKLKDKKDLKRMITAMKKGILKVKEEYDGSKYRTQLTHRDMHFDNVLYNKKTKKYKIIDISGLENEILAHEIMVIISDLIKNNPSRNKKMITEIMKGYSSQIKLTRKEKQVIPLLMIVRKLGECLWLLEQHKKGKINRKDRDFHLKGSVEQLETAINQFENLKQIFKKSNHN